MPSGDKVHVTLTIPSLAFETCIGFPSMREFALAERMIFRPVSGARFPPYEYIVGTRRDPPSLWIHIEPLAGGQARVAFSGAVTSPEYEVDLAGFHWDVSKVLNGLVMDAAAAQELVPLHAACVEGSAGTVMLPGHSGAGKSSIAFASRALGLRVGASELAFVREGRFVAGNGVLTIDAAALHLFGMTPLESLAEDGVRVTLPLQGLVQPRIDRIVFPQVDLGEIRTREITPRRARMLLFENVITQMPTVQLLAQETWPVWRPPPRSVVEAIMRELIGISERAPVVVAGHPIAIAQALAKGSL